MTHPQPSSSSSPRLTWVGWIAALVLMVGLLGIPPVQRTQEARVLETAREMLGQPMQGWLIPHLNGQLRTEKPPLAYWLAAIAFEIGGVSEGVGRVPFALFGWGTLLITWAIARRLFDRRAGFFAAAALLSGMMFARHARLAETDILAVFFVTAAIGCILRADGQHLGWLALSGAMMGGAILAKGLPAIFAVLFLFGWAAATRDWRLLWRWAISGAPIFMLAIGLPWFLYVRSTVGLKTIADEAEIGVSGMEHKGSLFQYIPQLLQAVAPWTALTVLAIVLASARWRSDRRLRAILVWALAVIVPLCFGGQKQYHYLFPAMPALAVLTGWLIDLMLARDLPPPERTLTQFLFAGTLVAILFCSGVLLTASRFRDRGASDSIDWILLALCTAGVGTALWMYVKERERGAVLAFAIAAAIVMTVMTQAWMPSMIPYGNARTVAAGIRAVGPGPYYFYGDNVSLPLIFSLQQRVRRLPNIEELTSAIREHPDLIVIAQTKSGVSPPPVPPELERAAAIRKEDQMFEVYRVRPAAK